MRAFSFVTSLLLVIAALAAVFFLDVPVTVILTWGLGLLCLGWLVLLVTLPWNLHLQARRVLVEMKASRDRGIEVTAEREGEVQAVRRRTLLVCVGAHVFSAVAVALGAWLFDSPIGYYFAAFYLLSTFLRPAVEYHRHVLDRLSTLMREVRYPRDDVQSLLHDVEELQAWRENQMRISTEQARELRQWQEQSVRRAVETERALVAISRKFEETVDRLTDNQEVVAGIKAFVRLIQQQGHTRP